MKIIEVFDRLEISDNLYHPAKLVFRQCVEDDRDADKIFNYGENHAQS